MPSLEQSVACHYTLGSLEQAILAGIAASGRSPDTIAEEDLAAVDEFHMGGRQATADMAERLALGPEHDVLDIGCGIGGTARYLAGRTGCRVVGVDITEEYVAVAERLTAMVGLADRVRYRVGSATRLPLENGSVDLALLLHMGMNVADKPALCAEAARVVRPGGRFVVYDVMRVGEGDVAFPVAWAATSETSFLGRPQEYRQALRQAGFEIVDERDRSALAVDMFGKMQGRMAETGPPPLGLHILMGAEAPRKVANLLANLQAGRIAPIEMMCRRA